MFDEEAYFEAHLEVWELVFDQSTNDKENIKTPSLSKGKQIYEGSTSIIIEKNLQDIMRDKEKFASPKKGIVMEVETGEKRRVVEGPGDSTTST